MKQILLWTYMDSNLHLFSIDDVLVFAYSLDCNSPLAGNKDDHAEWTRKRYEEAGYLLPKDLRIKLALQLAAEAL